MEINTLSFNSRKGEVIPIDDIDDAVIDQYFLTEDESKLKQMIWKS